MSVGMLAKAVGNTTIMAMLYHLEPNNPNVGSYGEIAMAVERASNEDPLFPNAEGGCGATASILVALAWYESRFSTSAIGDAGKSFGLFQIQVPTAKVEAKILLTAISATYVAVGLIRQSFRSCEERPWNERLSWYVASNGCPTHKVIVKKSIDRLLLAQRLFARFFPQDKMPDKLPALPEKK